MHRTLTLILAGVAAAAATLWPVPAHAVRPTSETFPLAFTQPAPFLSGVCGFAVTSHLEGTVTLTDFFAGDGTFTHEVAQLRAVESFSANGHEIVGRVNQPIQTVANPDGTFTVATNGIEMITLPGAGPVIGSAGRLVVLFAADNTPIEVTQEAGRVFSNPEAICAALAP